MRSINEATVSSTGEVLLTLAQDCDGGQALPVGDHA
jgi:hypothetical protein